MRRNKSEKLRVLFDIGHPGHYHLFRNTIKQVLENGGDAAIVLRDKDNAGFLSRSLGVRTFPVSGHKKGLVKKAIHSVSSLFRFLFIIREYKPDVVVGEGSFYLAQPAFLTGTPSVMVCMNDHAWLENALFYPFTTKILTSHSFTVSFGRKQKRFQGYLQQLYLSPEVFAPDEEIYGKLGLSRGDPYAIIRSVAWTAHHDIGREGFSLEVLRRAVDLLDKKMNVFISSESPLPEDLERYAFPCKPSEFQDALAFSSLSLGDGATVAAESAVLGIPTIHMSPIVPGYIADMEKRGLLHRCENWDELEKTIQSITEHGEKERAKAHMKAELANNGLHKILYETIIGVT